MEITAWYEKSARYGQLLQVATEDGAVEPLIGHDSRRIVGTCAEPDGAQANSYGLIYIDDLRLPPMSEQQKEALIAALQAELLRLAAILPPETTQPRQTDIDRWPDQPPKEWTQHD